MKITKSFAFQLMREGIEKKRLFLIDAGYSLLVLSKPLLIGINLLMFGVTILNLALFQASSTVLVWALVLLVGFGFYIALGVGVGGVEGRRLKYLLVTPAYLGWMFYITTLGLVGYRSNLWVRTRRS
jgi:hypothetical protein